MTRNMTKRGGNKRLNNIFCAYGVSKFMCVILKCENISFIWFTLEGSLMPIACVLNLFNTFVIRSDRGVQIHVDISF